MLNLTFFPFSHIWNVSGKHLSKPINKFHCNTNVLLLLPCQMQRYYLSEWHVLFLFFYAIAYTAIYQHCSSQDKDCKSLGSVQGYNDVRIKAKQWMEGDTSHTYSQWKAMAPTKSAASKAVTGESRSEARKRHLMEKYGRKWRERTKRKESPEVQGFREEEWLRQVLFTPSNRAAREMACTMIESLCQVYLQVKKCVAH